MKIFALLGALALACVSLGGCVVTGNPSADATNFNANLAADVAAFNQQVGQDLPAACALSVSADVTFQTVAATGKISSGNVSAEKAAMAGVTSLCANPSSLTNPLLALPTLANAYAAIVEAGKTS